MAVYVCTHSGQRKKTHCVSKNFLKLGIQVLRSWIAGCTVNFYFYFQRVFTHYCDKEIKSYS